MLAFLSFAVLLSAIPPSAGTDQGLDQCYQHTYNLKFSEAHRCLADWEKAKPDDPMGPVSDAMAYLFYDFDRLKVLRLELFKDKKAFLNRKKPKPDPQTKQKFEDALQRSQQLAQKKLQSSPHDERALLANVLRLVLKSDYDALIDFQYSQALNEIKKATAQAREVLAKHPDCYDANLAIGMENYLLSLKPTAVRWFLRMTGAHTSKKTGIAKLRIVAEKGNYLKPYAKVLLAIAALRDNHKKKAREILDGLAKEFPNNDLFQTEFKKLS